MITSILVVIIIVLVAALFVVLIRFDFMEIERDYYKSVYKIESDYSKKLYSQFMEHLEREIKK